MPVYVRKKFKQLMAKVSAEPEHCKEQWKPYIPNALILTKKLCILPSQCMCFMCFSQ
jgi:hypothetical protein